MPARQTPTGTILVDVPERKEAGAVLYARVSSADQRADLDRQVARLAAFAAFEHRDRLARFGSEYIEAALAASGRRLLVVEPDEVKDVVADMIDVLTSFCARLYGRRSARRRAEKAIKAAGPRSNAGWRQARCSAARITSSRSVGWLRFAL